MTRPFNVAPPYHEWMTRPFNVAPPYYESESEKV